MWDGQLGDVGKEEDKGPDEVGILRDMGRA